jgi:hypothetical protein
VSALNRFKKPSLLLLLFLFASLSFITIGTYAAGAKTSQHSRMATTAMQHDEYVFPTGAMDVYDMDHGQALVKEVSLPTTQDVRGVVASPATGMLYVSYGGDGGPNGNGSLLKYNLLTNTVVWTKNYPFGIDSMGILPDGSKIYMPDGTVQYDGIWHILDARDGSVSGSITVASGIAPHNTLVSLNGTHVYLGGTNNNYLWDVDTATNHIIQKIGPLVAGVRPFTINGTETLAFTTSTGFLGFQVSSITTGKVLYTVPIAGFTAPSSSDAPSHGISLSPDEKELYVIDTPNSYVHVFDVSGLPTRAPKQVADVALTKPMTGTESPCSYSCQREGWLQHSRDGRFVYVGDSGDVIDTSTRKSIANLPALYNSRKHIEIDWANGVPVFATTRHGVGYVTSTKPTPTPSPTASPSSTPGTILAQDTFQRTNQLYWGTASDGHKWSGDANSQSIFSISKRTGQVAGGSGIYNAILGATRPDAEVLFSGSISSFTNSNLGAVLRWTDTNNWYKAYIDGSRLIIQRRINGSYSTLGSTAFTATTGTSYSLRFQVVGTALSAKVWQTGSTEPSTWMLTVSDTALPSGDFGLRIQLQTGVTVNVASFLATTVPGE